MNNVNEKDRDWALNKIKKCLALFAKSTGNEANTALRQAKALMQKYGIDEADPKLNNISESFVIIGKGSKNPPQWQSHLAGVCARAFDCRTIMFNKYDYTRKGNLENIKCIRFIGIEPSSEIATYTFEVLARQLKSDRKKYLKTLHSNCSLTTRRRRADLFADNWVNAVIGLVMDFAQNHQALNMIDAYVEKYYDTTPIKYAEKTKDKRYDSARIAGYVAGNNAHLSHAMKHTSEEQLSLSFEGQH